MNLYIENENGELTYENVVGFHCTDGYQETLTVFHNYGDVSQISLNGLKNISFIKPEKKGIEV